MPPTLKKLKGHIAFLTKNKLGSFNCRETYLNPPVKCFTECFKAVLLLWTICVFVSCDSNPFASVHCCLVVTCWGRADLLALVGDVYCILLLSHVVSWVRYGT